MINKDGFINQELTCIESKKGYAKVLLSYSNIVISIPVILLLGGFLYFLRRQPSQLNQHETVFSNPDGSVLQVTAYLKRNTLKDANGFKAVHWSKLKKDTVFGQITYRVFLLYKSKGDRSEFIMKSKLFELDEFGTVLLVLDVGPFLLKN